MRKLVPRMQLSAHASQIVNPLLTVLDGPYEELRRDALDAICALAVVLGQDFAIFVPQIRKVRQGGACSTQGGTSFAACDIGDYRTPVGCLQREGRQA